MGALFTEASLDLWSAVQAAAAAEEEEYQDGGTRLQFLSHHI